MEILCSAIGAKEKDVNLLYKMVSQHKVPSIFMPLNFSTILLYFTTRKLNGLSLDCVMYLNKIKVIKCLSCA